MSPAVVGGLLGAAAGIGLALVLAGLPLRSRPQLSDRVLPYVRDLAGVRARVRPVGVGVGGAVSGAFGPSLRRVAGLVGRVLGGSTDVRRRLDRAGSTLDVDQLRVEQVLWGVGAALGTTAVGLAGVLAGSVSVGPLLVAVVAAVPVGVVARDQRLTTQVQDRERRMLREFPAISDLLALAVAAGEGPVSALDRVTRLGHGELPRELGRLLGEVRTGTPVTVALDRMAARTGVVVLARFAATLAVAIERGTPLVDVLHAQAGDVREAGRRALIEAGARKEVLMMVPVVFLVLPVTVVFAFYPGVVGLQLTTP